VNNWEEMQHVWDHTFRERLKIDPKECSILLTGVRGAQRPLWHWRAHAYRARQTRR
jgi:actin-related protein